MKRSVAVLIVVCSFFAAPPVGAQGVTQLSITSEAGDFIGQGATYAYDGNDVWQVYQFGERLQINIHPSDYSTWWTLIISAPQEQSLGLGTFPARKFPGIGVAGLDFSGNGRSCDAINGTLTIRHLMFNDNGEISEVWLTFEQHCEGAQPALRGELMMNVPLPVPIRISSWGQLKTQYR